MPYPGLLHPEPLPLWQATADPYLHRRQSKTQRQVYLWVFCLASLIYISVFMPVQHSFFESRSSWQECPPSLYRGHLDTTPGPSWWEQPTTSGIGASKSSHNTWHHPCLTVPQHRLIGNLQCDISKWLLCAYRSPPVSWNWAEDALTKAQHQPHNSLSLPSAKTRTKWQIKQIILIHSEIIQFCNK